MNSQSLLRTETLQILASRRGANPNFTKKHLANELGINLETFYKFLNGKRAFRRKTALKYFSPILPKDSWEKIDYEFTREETASANIEAVKLFLTDDSYPEQTRDQFELNSDPLSWALMYLLETEDYKPSLEWKAQKLNISVDETKEKLDRLERLGLIVKTSTTGYKRTEKVLATTDGKSNLSIVRHRERLLPILAQAFPMSPREQYFYNWYCTIDPSDLPKFQSLIRKTMRQFEREQLTMKPKRVYSFMIGLFPMTQ